jgi:hypothetical protein
MPATFLKNEKGCASMATADHLILKSHAKYQIGNNQERHFDFFIYMQDPGHGNSIL